MRYSAQTLFGNQFAGFATHTVGLVLDTDKCVLEMLDKLQLSRSELTCLLLGESGCSLFKNLECRGRICNIITLGIVDVGAEGFVLFLSLIELFKNQCLELLEFFVTITLSFTHNRGYFYVKLVYLFNKILT